MDAFEIVKNAFKVLEPPPETTTSAWADKHRILTSATSPEPGQWYSDRVPYAKAMMDAMDDQDTWKVVFMVAAQITKTECILNNIGKNIHLDPSSMLLLLPDEQFASDFSKDRLLPMLESSQPLKQRVLNRKKGTGKDNTKLSKRFPGGYLAIVGAKSPTGLSSRPIKRVYADEVDRMPTSTGYEGHAIQLAEKRTTNFLDRKVILCSTPALDDDSEIKRQYENSDKRQLYVNCPHCDESQVLEWEQVTWVKRKNKDSSIEQLPDTAAIACVECGVLIDENERIRICREGVWIATAAFTGIAGFHASSLVSLMTDLKTIVAEYIEAENDPEKLKVFWNTRLARTWKEEGVSVDEDILYSRREDYTSTVPDGVLVLTAGVDIQSDRLECEVKGWGEHEESWGIGYYIIPGSPHERSVWVDLEKILFKKYANSDGVQFDISLTCIDSGYLTQIVYEFCHKNRVRNVLPVKGRAQEGLPAIPGFNFIEKLKKTREITPIILGVNGIKSIIYHRLTLVQSGFGYYHFPKKYTKEYFEQLTAEEKITEKGEVKWKKIRARNEVLDIAVYNYAAIKLVNPDWEKLKQYLREITGKTLSHAELPKYSLSKKIIRRRKINENGHKNLH
ncbi:MAG: phage terminase large subunit family protein [Cyanobacteria bacterium P01_H01_bin.74]